MRKLAEFKCSMQYKKIQKYRGKWEFNVKWKSPALKDKKVYSDDTFSDADFEVDEIGLTSGLS